MKLIPGQLMADISKLSKSLKQFNLQKISLKTSTNKTSLVIELTRSTSLFWLSLFIPSMCLILAADITLFIDEEHFKATITVALTANLVMYTLYQNIQEKLPEDSKLKLIDIWLLHGLLMPMVAFVILVINEFVNKKCMESLHMKSTKVGDSVIKVESKTKATGMLEKLDKDQANKIDAGNQMEARKLRPKTCMFVCKVLVPLTSLIFFITFFIVIKVHD